MKFSVPDGNGVLELSEVNGKTEAKIIGAGTVLVTAEVAGDSDYNGTTVTTENIMSASPAMILTKHIFTPQRIFTANGKKAPLRGFIMTAHFSLMMTDGSILFTETGRYGSQS